MITLAQHRRTEDALASQPRVRGRLNVLPAGSTQARSRRESLLVRCVSIVEAFVGDQLVIRLEQMVPVPRTPLAETLYIQYENNARTWPAMTAAYKDYVGSGVSIKSFVDWERVNAVIEARNAVVHGLGRYTTRQQRYQVHTKTKSGLLASKFDLSSDGLGIVVTPDAVEAVAGLLRDYLEWLDSELTKP